MQDEVIICT